MRVDRPHLDMKLETVTRFCKDMSWTFFNEFGLISHQINLFNQLIWLFGCLVVGRASINQIGEGRHAMFTFEKIRLDKPSFWIERNHQEEECLKLFLRHAQLKNMTYSFKLKMGPCLYTRKE